MAQRALPAGTAQARIGPNALSSIQTPLQTLGFIAAPPSPARRAVTHIWADTPPAVHAARLTHTPLAAISSVPLQTGANVVADAAAAILAGRVAHGVLTLGAVETMGAAAGVGPEAGPAVQTNWVTESRLTGGSCPSRHAETLVR